MKHINSVYVKLANRPVTLAPSANVNIYFKIPLNQTEPVQGGSVQAWSPQLKWFCSFVSFRIKKNNKLLRQFLDILTKGSKVL